MSGYELYQNYRHQSKGKPTGTVETLWGDLTNDTRAFFEALANRVDVMINVAIELNGGRDISYNYTYNWVPELDFNVNMPLLFFDYDDKGETVLHELKGLPPRNYHIEFKLTFTLRPSNKNFIYTTQFAVPVCWPVVKSLKVRKAS